MRDEDFSRTFAQHLQIPFEKADFDTVRYASQHKISVEMAARQLRYAWFETLRTKHHATAIAVAHHKNDSVETVLLNLLRGTGIHGLTGIKKHSGYIIRPLLHTGKQEIMNYIHHHHLPYITDSSNLSPKYTRNKIRLEILPLLQTLNPSVVDAIERTAMHLLQAAKIYDAAIETAKPQVLSDGNNGEKRINIPKLQAFPSPEALLYEILTGYGFHPSVIRNINDLLSAQPGKHFSSPTHQLLKDRDTLILKPSGNTHPPSTATFPLAENTTAITHPLHMKMETLPHTPDSPPTTDKTIAHFDKDKLHFPLHLRKWQQGDTFIPFGMKGQQKIAKYYKDHHYNQFQKENTWLLCSGNNIIWIVGERIDNRYRINETTKTVYRLTCYMNEKNP
jgi:tRNA(Ile)-lysidine synthase